MDSHAHINGKVCVFWFFSFTLSTRPTSILSHSMDVWKHMSLSSHIDFLCSLPQILHFLLFFRIDNTNEHKTWKSQCYPWTVSYLSVVFLPHWVKKTSSHTSDFKGRSFTLTVELDFLWVAILHFQSVMIELLLYMGLECSFNLQPFLIFQEPHQYSADCNWVIVRYFSCCKYCMYMYIKYTGWTYESIRDPKAYLTRTNCCQANNGTWLDHWESILLPVDIVTHYSFKENQCCIRSDEAQGHCFHSSLHLKCIAVL